MIYRRTGRVVGLVLSLAMLWAGTVLAHALPGSALVFSRDGGDLRLDLSLPVEDLLVAEPLLRSLGKLEPGATVPASTVAQLARYFEKHLDVSGVGVRALQLDTVALASAENEHVGVYALLELVFRGPLNDNAAPSVSARYTAVMHEVRNHRAVLYWQGAGGALQRLRSVGFSSGGETAIPLGG